MASVQLVFLSWASEKDNEEFFNPRSPFNRYMAFQDPKGDPLAQIIQEEDALYHPTLELQLFILCWFIHSLKEDHETSETSS